MKSSLGAFGESWAAAYLQRLGYVILERNVRFREGEIDIVARDGDDLVFVEVKTRRSAAFGTPQESITRARYDRLATAIATFLQQRELEPPSYRIDVVAILIGSNGQVVKHDILQGVEQPR